MSIRPLIVALSLGLAATAPAHADMSMGHGKPIGRADAANAAAMDTMMKAMTVKPSGNPDKDFARMMLAHHQGAVAMAKIELQYGSDPELRKLATTIIAAQEKEITQMQAWLAKH